MSSDHTQSYVKLCNVVATFHKTLICGTFFSEKIDSSLWAEENGIFALLLLLFISLLALLIMAFVEVVMCVREVVSGATDAANIILPRCPNAHPWCDHHRHNHHNHHRHHRHRHRHRHPAQLPWTWCSSVWGFIIYPKHKQLYWFPGLVNQSLITTNLQT